MMRLSLALLLVAIAALGECHGNKNNNRDKRELLVRSKRRWVLSTIELEEEMNVKYPYKITTMFNDKTTGERHEFKISGDGVDENPETTLFSIDKETGEVFVHRRVDREAKPMYHITFDVYNATSNTKLDNELAFDVEIKDINDNPPQFIEPQREAYVKENSQEDYIGVDFHAADADKENTENSTFTISVASQNPKEPKILTEGYHLKKARLKLKGCFDYNKAKQYTVVVEAKDKGKPPLSSSTTLILNIIDTNSHPPSFKKLENQSPIEIMEMTTKKDLLRFAVEDKDTPNTDGWRATYSIISGNEDQVFYIETDPKTNEGVLSVVKEKNYNVTTLVKLQVQVKNIEPLSICKDGKLISDEKLLPPPNSINVTVKMLDDNDPPEFEEKISDVYQKEEIDPGQELFVPTVHDVDSTQFSFKLLGDEAGWLKIDEKTGKVTSVKRMDRESPFVKNSTYKVFITATDNGEPQATSTSTINIHLKDINDNTPKLITNNMTLCENADKVILSAEDADDVPFKGPFVFTLDVPENMKEHWKLDPSIGEQAGLVLRVPLPHGKYSVPLKIQDQQSMVGKDTVHVTVCDCEGGNACRGKKPLSYNIGPAGIGLIVATLSLFLILLFALTCYCGKKKFVHIEKSEGHQTLIQYNDEGGGVACRTEPSPLSPIATKTVVDGYKQSFTQAPQMPQAMQYNADIFTTQHSMQMNQMRSMSLHHQRASRRSHDDYSTYGTRGFYRMNSYHGDTLFSQRPFHLLSQKGLDFLIRERKAVADADLESQLEYQPLPFDYEGRGSISQSLDKLSVSNLDDGLDFLDDVGPRFKALAEICNPAMKKQLQRGSLRK